jgi:hypothetical protein
VLLYEKKNKYKKINKYSTVKIFPKLNRKSWKDAKMIPLNTQTHDRSLSMLGTGTSIKVVGLNQFNGPKLSLCVK